MSKERLVAEVTHTQLATVTGKHNDTNHRWTGY